jgi:hypothetical protein
VSVININALHSVASGQYVGRQQGHTMLDCAEVLAIANLNKDNNFILGAVDYLNDISHIVDTIKKISSDYNTIVEQIKNNELLLKKDDGTNTKVRFVHGRRMDDEYVDYSEKFAGHRDIPVVHFNRRVISG